MAWRRYRRDVIPETASARLTGRTRRSVKLAQHTRDGLAAVEGGVCRQATSLEELVELLDTGLEQRAVAHTELNAESSRSHLLVSIVLTSTNRRSGKKTRGKLMLVDLAGSERVEKSGVQGDELKEAASINKSLSAIGDVIAALSQKSKHVPYRNHPLTMLMSDSIGGTAKTLMIVNASPSSEHASETANSEDTAKSSQDVTNPPTTALCVILGKRRAAGAHNITSDPSRRALPRAPRRESLRPLTHPCYSRRPRSWR